MTSLLRDLGCVMNPKVVIDAKATEHILDRQDIGRMKHVDVAHLRLQDEVRTSRLRVQRGKSENNVADTGTKVFSSAVIAKHSTTLAYINMDSDGCRLRKQGGKDRDRSQRATKVRVQINQRDAAAGDHARVHQTMR